MVQDRCACRMFLLGSKSVYTHLSGVKARTGSKCQERTIQSESLHGPNATYPDTPRTKADPRKPASSARHSYAKEGSWQASVRIESTCEIELSNRTARARQPHDP